MNTPKFFGGLVACLLGSAIIWGIVTGSLLYGVMAAGAVLFAGYFVLCQLNAYERHEINKHKQKRKRSRGDR